MKEKKNCLLYTLVKLCFRLFHFRTLALQTGCEQVRGCYGLWFRTLVVAQASVRHCNHAKGPSERIAPYSRWEDGTALHLPSQINILGPPNKSMPFCSRCLLRTGIPAKPSGTARNGLGFGAPATAASARRTGFRSAQGERPGGT